MQTKAQKQAIVEEAVQAAIQVLASKMEGDEEHFLVTIHNQDTELFSDEGVMTGET